MQIHVKNTVPLVLKLRALEDFSEQQVACRAELWPWNVASPATALLHKDTADVTVETVWHVNCEVLTLTLGKILSVPGSQLLLLWNEGLDSLPTYISYSFIIQLQCSLVPKPVHSSRTSLCPELVLCRTWCDTCLSYPMLPGHSSMSHPQPLSCLKGKDLVIAPIPRGWCSFPGDVYILKKALRHGQCLTQRNKLLVKLNSCSADIWDTGR